MKTTVRLLSIILALIMAMSLMASCGLLSGKGNETEATTTESITTEVTTTESTTTAETTTEATTTETTTSISNKTYDTIEQVFKDYPDDYNQTVKKLKKMGLDFSISDNTMYFVIKSPKKLDKSAVKKLEKYYDKNLLKSLKSSFKDAMKFVSAKTVYFDVTVKNPDGSVAFNKSYPYSLS